MSIKIKKKEWYEFFIGGENGIFDISSSSSGIDKNKLKEADTALIPYITRTDAQNGINKFIADKQEDKYEFDEENVITIGLDTQTIFFQPHKFYSGQNIQVLRHKSLNKYTATFIIPLLNVQMEKFNWGGNGATLGRLFRTKIMLPVNAKGKPDWLFMEKHSKDSLIKKRASYKQFADDKLENLKYKKIDKLTDKKWEGFFIENIADIISGRDIYSNERESGNTPYISSTAKNNGIGYFVSNKNTTLEKNCLSVNRNGSVGFSFYHPYEGLFSNDCRKLRLKIHNHFVGHFVASQITKQKEKYNYGYKMGTGRLKRQKIMLPVTSSGKPDDNYMEQYIKNLIHKKLNLYLKTNF